MKILHINTLDHGGAAKAAIRLHTAMLVRGMDSTFLSLNKSRNEIPNHISYFDKHSVNKGWQKWKKVNPLNLLKRELNLKRWSRNESIKQNINGKLEFISFHETPYRIHEIDGFEKYDIIHLHWIADFLDWKTFFPKVVNKKIVWSLHDMGPFTGGYHYSSGYKGYEYGDVDAPFFKGDKWEGIFQQELEAKLNLLSSLPLDIHVVGLSNWMSSCAKQSLLFGKYQHYCIPNTVDDEIYKTIDKSTARHYLNLPKDKKLILFISEDVNNPRKGYQIITQLIKRFNNRSDIAFIVVGKSNIHESDNNVYSLGYLDSDTKVVLALNSADVVLIPSMEDNLPNTALEALMCGVPVVANNIGGMPDLIYSESQGCLSNNISEMGDFIEMKLTEQRNAEEIRKSTLLKFNAELIVNSYKLIYECNS